MIGFFCTCSCPWIRFVYPPSKTMSIRIYLLLMDLSGMGLGHGTSKAMNAGQNFSQIAARDHGVYHSKLWYLSKLWLSTQSISISAYPAFFNSSESSRHSQYIRYWGDGRPKASSRSRALGFNSGIGPVSYHKFITRTYRRFRLKPGLIEDLMVLRHHAVQNKGSMT